MGALRKATPQEEQFIAFMIARSGRKFAAGWQESLMVSSIDVGESGSLNLHPGGIRESGRDFGDEISEFRFKDKDGVKVMASLNVDQNGRLYELDIWKEDFSDLIAFPEKS